MQSDPPAASSIPIPVDSPDDFGKGFSKETINGVDVVVHSIGDPHVCFASRSSDLSSLTVLVPLSVDAASLTPTGLSATGYKVAITKPVPCSFGPKTAFLKITRGKKNSGKLAAFDGVLRFVIEQLRQSPKTANTHRIVYDAIREYKIDHSHSPRSGLKEKEIVGLYGELYFLKNYASRAGDWKKAMNCWHGFDAEMQDFQGRCWTVEVKASRSIRRTHLWINGLGQLEAPPNGALYLCHLYFDSASSGAGCLSGLVKEIEEQLPVDLIATFRERLEKAQYDEELNINYDEIKFGPPETRYYDVLKRNFPRLTKQNAASGFDKIREVKYKLSCDDLDPYEVRDHRLVEQTLEN